MLLGTAAYVLIVKDTLDELYYSDVDIVDTISSVVNVKTIHKYYYSSMLKGKHRRLVLVSM